MYSRRDVSRLMEEEFDAAVSVESVPNSDNVYRASSKFGDPIKPSSSDTLYVRPIQETERYRKLTSIQDVHGVGMPRSCVIEKGGVSVLVSVPANGRPLSHVLPVYLAPGVWRTQHTPLIEAYEGLGRNISVLHRETILGKKEMDFSFFSSVPFRVGSLFDIDEFRSWVGSEVLEEIRQAFELGTGAEADFSYTHGDITPHNMYYSDGAIQVIDISLIEGPIVRDLANLIMSLELMACRLPYPAADKIEHLIEAFESGYNSETKDSIPGKILIKITTLSFLCKAANYMVLHREGYGFFKKVQFTWDLHWLEKLINRYLSEVKAGA